MKISATYSAKEETVSMRSTLRVARKRRRLGFNFVLKERSSKYSNKIDINILVKEEKLNGI